MGVIYGTPGRSLEDGESSLDRSRRIAGRAGELATAAVLNELQAARPGMAVLHSLRPPKGGMDIDHVVVAGARVWVLDSKCWEPGFHWGRGGRHRVGLREKAHYRTSAPRAARFLQSYLGRRTVVEEPVLVVWPSSKRKPLWLWAWKPDKVSRVSGRRLRRLLERSVPTTPADPWVVERLRRLLA